MPRRCSRRPLIAWRGAVGAAGVVEAGQDVLAAADQGPGPRRGLLEPVWDGLLQGADGLLRQVLSQARAPRPCRPGTGRW